MERTVHHFRNELFNEIRPVRRRYQGNKVIGYELVSTLRLGDGTSKPCYRTLVMPDEHDDTTSFAISEVDFSPFIAQPLKLITITDILKNDKVSEAIPHGGDVHKLILFNIKFMQNIGLYPVIPDIQIGFGIGSGTVLTPSKRIIVRNRNSRYAIWAEDFQ